MESTVIIDSGDSLSDESFDLDGWLFCGIYLPGWTAAGITFQVAPQTGSTGSAGTFVDVYNEAGTERTIASFSGARTILFDNPAEWAGIRYVKVRSGTTGTPVNQGAERVLRLLLRPW